MKNYTKILTALRRHQIRPIIQSTLYVSPKIQEWQDFNRRVDELNALLREYAKANGISFLDINSELALNGALNPAYTYDGVHLLGTGYEIWRTIVLREIERDPALAQSGSGS